MRVDAFRGDCGGRFGFRSAPKVCTTAELGEKPSENPKIGTVLSKTIDFVHKML